MRTDFEQASAVGASGRSHHVPRNRSRPALLRQGRRAAGRQRARDDQREAPWRWACSSIRRSTSRCRSSGINYPRFRIPRPARYAVCAAVRRGARARQRAAAEAGRHAARRQRRLLRASRVPASDQLYVSGGERESERMLTWPMSTGREPRLAVHEVPEAGVAVSVPVRRLTCAIARPPRPSSCRTARRRTGSAARGNTGAAATASRSNGTWFGRVALEARGARPMRITRRSAAHVCEIRGARLERLVLRRVPEAPRQRRVFRRARSRSLQPATSSGCSTTRGSTACRRPASASIELGMAARLVLVQHLRAVPARPVPGAGVRAGPRRSIGWEPITGIGAAVNLRAPWNTILRVDAGKSFLRRYRTTDRPSCRS